MIEFVNYNNIFLNLSEVWLNDPEIKYLTQSPDLTVESQKKWYKELGNRTDYKIWGISFNGKPIGACGLKNITTNDCEYWGYIGEKDYWGKGIGKLIIDRMIEESKKLDHKSIWLKVIKDNIRAIRLYEKKGFLTKSMMDESIIMRKLL